jgi:hypothetical protein
VVFTVILEKQHLILWKSYQNIPRMFSQDIYPWSGMDMMELQQLLHIYKEWQKTSEFFTLEKISGSKKSVTGKNKIK